MKKKAYIKKIKTDLKGFLEKTKNGLKKLGEETSIFAKRSEKELSKIARAGRAEVDILNSSIKKNRLLYQLGKKAYQLSTQGKLTARNLKKLCASIDLVEKKLKAGRRSRSKYLKKRK